MKLIAEDWLIMDLEERKEFETDFKKLYDFLSKRYDQEIELHSNLNDKVHFIQSLMDKITEALHDAKHKHQISELTEQHIEALNGLRNVFEKRMNDLYLGVPTIPKKIDNEKSKGRPKSITKSFVSYINKEWTPKGKEAFVGILKSKFKTDIYKSYKEGDKQPLNLITLALFDLKIFPTGLKKKQMFESTGMLLLDEVPKGQSNFNQFMKNTNYKDYDDFDKYYRILKELVEEIGKIYPDFKID
ncbi:hypothetical protein [Gaetbulibacter jejuensis]